jgi:hypothetical protein
MARISNDPGHFCFESAKVLASTTVILNLFQDLCLNHWISLDTSRFMAKVEAWILKQVQDDSDGAI